MSNSSDSTSNCKCLGCHLGIEKSLTNSLKSAWEAGCSCPQYFFGSPYKIARKSFTKADIDSANIFLKSTGQQVFTHLPYTFNLAGLATEKRLAWDGDDELDARMRQILDSISSETKILGQLNCEKSGSVIHMGSFPNTQKGLDAIVKSIDQIDFSGSAPLILETMVGTGSVLGKTFEQLAYVRNKTSNKDHIKFCVDTCHIFAEGLYDLQSEASVDKCFEAIDRELGRENLMLFHLNDSKDKFGAKKDRHQYIGQGEIWSPNIKPFLYFAKRAIDWNIPLVLETDSSDIPVVREFYKNL